MAKKKVAKNSSYRKRVQEQKEIERLNAEQQTIDNQRMINGLMITFAVIAMIISTLAILKLIGLGLILTWSACMLGYAIWCIVVYVKKRETAALQMAIVVGLSFITLVIAGFVCR